MERRNFTREFKREADHQIAAMRLGTSGSPRAAAWAETKTYRGGIPIVAALFQMRRGGYGRNLDARHMLKQQTEQPTQLSMFDSVSPVSHLGGFREYHVQCVLRLSPTITWYVLAKALMLTTHDAFFIRPSAPPDLTLPGDLPVVQMQWIGYRTETVSRRAFNDSK